MLDITLDSSLLDQSEYVRRAALLLDGEEPVQGFRIPVLQGENKLRIDEGESLESGIRNHVKAACRFLYMWESRAASPHAYAKMYQEFLRKHEVDQIRLHAKAKEIWHEAGGREGGRATAPTEEVQILGGFELKADTIYMIRLWRGRGDKAEIMPALYAPGRYELGHEVVAGFPAIGDFYYDWNIWAGFSEVPLYGGSKFEILAENPSLEGFWGLELEGAMLHKLCKP
jgi:hypothetical protein